MVTTKMSIASRKELLYRLKPRYLRANKPDITKNSQPRLLFPNGGDGGTLFV